MIFMQPLNVMGAQIIQAGKVIIISVTCTDIAATIMKLLNIVDRQK